MKKPIIIVAALVLAACSTSAGPKGWSASPGIADHWTTGDGAALQVYSYSRRSFSGSLQDLASRVTIDALLRNRGARLQRSVPLGPCPGAAGLATFTLGNGRVLQEGFAVHQDQAVQVTYTRPADAPVDPNVAAAMQSTLC